jgi:hypothetical protein
VCLHRFALNAEVPDTDSCSTEFECGLFRSVLLQGFVYLSTGHICFYAFLPVKGVRFPLNRYRSDLTVSCIVGQGVEVRTTLCEELPNSAVPQALVRAQRRCSHLVPELD